MRINNTAAFALAGVIALTLAGCGETLPPAHPFGATGGDRRSATGRGRMASPSAELRRV